MTTAIDFGIDILRYFAFAGFAVWMCVSAWYSIDIMRALLVLLKTQAACNDRRLVDAFRDGVYPANVVPPHFHSGRRGTVLTHSHREGCTCQRCGQKYMVDLLVPDDLWERIKPEGKAVGAGMLCGRCIMVKIEAFDSYGSLLVSEANV
jgi:hypothetical protein